MWSPLYLNDNRSKPSLHQRTDHMNRVLKRTFNTYTVWLWNQTVQDETKIRSSWVIQLNTKKVHIARLLHLDRGKWLKIRTTSKAAICNMVMVGRPKTWTFDKPETPWYHQDLSVHRPSQNINVRSRSRWHLKLEYPSRTILLATLKSSKWMSCNCSTFYQVFRAGIASTVWGIRSALGNWLPMFIGDGRW